MKVQTVKIKKFKVLENIEEQINGNNIILLADNGKGKSSFIQFIEIALGSSNIPPNAKGEGEVIVDKDGNQFTLKVKVKDGKSVVEITGPDGLKDARKGSLVSLVGAMEFDIDEFVELSKSAAGRKKQVEIFKSFLPADVKEVLSKHKANNKAKFDERTEVNRQVKSLEVEIAAHPLNNFTDLDQFQPVDITSVYKELKEATEHNTEISGIQNRLNERVEAIKKQEAEITELERRIGILKEDVATKMEMNLQASAYLEENKPKDISGFESTIQGANDSNTKAEQAKALKAKRELLEKVKSESGDLTVLIETGRQCIADTIRDMEAPVQGLSFDEETLVYNGLPVNPDTLSTSEIMELGVRMKMAENPELGILFIQRGESLGAARLKEIQSIAEKSGWQIIMEQVERGTEKLHIELMEA